MIQVPIETNPQGYWFDQLVTFQSYAQAIREAYPGQFFEISGAVILELPHELHCPICCESDRLQTG